MKAGFIGLGSMGGPIARRLARQGFDVTGCDISPEMRDAFDEPGTACTDDPIATARHADMLGICVRTDAQLEAVAGDGTLFAALGEGGLVFLHSTVSPDLARRLDAVARAHGVGFIDVGVSGGGPAAIEGKLALFVGGDEADVARARPWLDAIGSTVVHLGPVGRGQEAKLLNNLISIANYGMSAAIVDVAGALGFETESFVAALSGGSAQSFALKVGPGFVRPRAGLGATGSFMGLHDLLKKDVEHARELGPESEAASMAALLASCEAMLARIRRAAAQADGSDAPTSARQTIDAYFAAVRAKDIDALMALYGDSPVFTLPNGKRFEGREALHDLHAHVFASGAPYPTPTRYMIDARGGAVEICAQLPDGTVRRTTNVYAIGTNNRIESITVYAQG